MSAILKFMKQSHGLIEQFKTLGSIYNILWTGLSSILECSVENRLTHGCFIRIWKTFIFS